MVGPSIGASEIYTENSSIIYFFQMGDVKWLKENVYNFSKTGPHGPVVPIASGVSDLLIQDPFLREVNNISILTWSIQYKMISGTTYLNGTANWNVNSSYIYNNTFHFYIRNQTAHLKSDQKFFNFYFHADIQKSWTISILL